MKCKNCGLPKEAHKPVPGEGGHVILLCPDGSGGNFPATAEVKVELHYRAGEGKPWIASWVHPAGGPARVTAAHPIEALQQAAAQITALFEHKTPEQEALDEAIKKS